MRERRRIRILYVSHFRTQLYYRSRSNQLDNFLMHGSDTRYQLSYTKLIGCGKLRTSSCRRWPPAGDEQPGKWKPKWRSQRISVSRLDRVDDDELQD